MTNGLWNLPPIRPSAYPTPPDLTARRAAVEAAAVPSPIPSVAVRRMELGGVTCVVCEPPSTRAVMLYFHGGGYRLGSAERSTSFASRLAEATDSTVVAVEYRLAPEHPFPAALHDAAAVYGHVVERGDGHVVAAGDSAGGGLAAALTVAASANGFPLPSALVLMSPWLDLTCTAATFTSRAGTDQLFSLEAARQAAAMYLQGHAATDPFASPGLAAMEGWPPSMILASTDEVLLDDSIGFASKLAREGTPVTCRFQAGVAHAWPAIAPDLPASRTALEDVRRFLKTFRGTPSPFPPSCPREP